MADSAESKTLDPRGNPVNVMAFVYDKRCVMPDIHDDLVATLPNYLFCNATGEQLTVYCTPEGVEAEADTIVAAHDPAILTASKAELGADDEVTIEVWLPHTAATSVVLTVEGVAITAQDLNMLKRATVVLATAGILDGDLNVGVQGHPHTPLVIPIDGGA